MATRAKEYIIPDEIRAVFTSPMIPHKERLSLTTKWFQKNWWRWTDFGVGVHTTTVLSVTEFAKALTRALNHYSIVINRQRVWTWMAQRNLPREDNFRVMAEIATGWQLEFALIVLEILTSEEPVHTL